MPSKSISVNITFRTVILFFLTLVCLFLFFYLSSIVALVFGSYVIFAALNPIVDNLTGLKIRNFHLSRGLAVTVVFLCFLAFLSLLIWAIVGPTYDEIIRLASDLNGQVQNLISKYRLKEIFGQERVQGWEVEIRKQGGELSKQLTQNPEQILNIGRNIFSGIIVLITFVALVLYQIINPARVRNFIIGFFHSQEKGQQLVTKAEEKLGGWLQGQFILMLFMAILSYIGFLIIGIPFALPLAIMVGLFDIVPLVGPTIAYIFVLIVSLALGEPWQLLAATLLFFILQQVEASFLIPKVMENSVGLDPIVVIVALMIGSSLMGTIGAILSVPFSAILMIVYQEWQIEKKRKANLQEAAQIQI